MEWLAENWFWLLIGILFVGMHLFGHGSHGGHDETDRTDAGVTGQNKSS